MRLELIRDVLDKQLVDEAETKMGRVDGVVLAVRDGQAPEVDHLQLGFEVLARRIGRRSERLLQWLRRRIRVRAVAVQTVHWPLVEEITRDHIKVSIDARTTPSFAWEQWLRKNVVERLPGGR